MRSWDRVGAVASAVCAVHCVLTGLALGLLSYAGLGFMGSMAADAIFLAVAVIIASVALYHGIKQHHSYRPAGVFVLGLVFVVIGHFVLRHDHAGHASEVNLVDTMSTVFAVFGGICFVLFHVLNMRLAKQCGCQHCSTGQ